VSLGGPFVPYDAGPRSEPAIDYDAGCSALFPKQGPQFTYPPCVQCLGNSDCPTGLVCETNSQAYNYYHHCVQCSSSSNCPMGQICNSGTYNQFLQQYGNDQCLPDCRTSPTSCNGFCEGDSGICPETSTIYQYNPYCYPQPPSFDTGWCKSGSDCNIDGGGACNFPTFNGVEVYPLGYGFGYCVQCTVDGGGCSAPDTICQLWTCPHDGPAGNCVFNCFFDAGACGVGTYCADAGIVSFDGGPDGGPLFGGSCTAGCQNASNCGGEAPVCWDGGCVQCSKSADCPDWAPGCGTSNWCYPSSNLCDNCTKNSDCPGTEFCGSSNCGKQQCMCYSDSDCPLDVPSCVGGSVSTMTGGVCACTDNTQCPGGYVCETRPPFQVNNGQTCNGNLQCGSTAGGGCIAACASNADCATNFAGTGNLICDTNTGFCVACAMDTDCTANADPTVPYIRPSCVLYPDGGDPFTSPTQYTGGGQCGCSDTSQCNGGYACQNAGYYGTCGPTCTYANGIDSCSANYGFGNCPGYITPFCNTYTGACVGCFDDYDCTSKNCNQPFCSNGTCVGCFSGDNCLTFPNNSCYFGNCQSYCSDNSTCPTDGGYACVQSPPYGNNQCMITCVMGDDAGMGTVSDAGNPCPADSPLCVTNSYSSDSTIGVCAQCFGYGDTTSCQSQGLNCCCGQHEYDYCYGYYLLCSAYCTF
jgi:Cys-rich repeat protein